MQIHAYCSWCNNKTLHKNVDQNKISRDVYVCQCCRNKTLKCRVPGCENMTKGRPGDLRKFRAKKNTIKNILYNINTFAIKNWDNKLCSEHDGTIANFENLGMTYDELENYSKIFVNRKINVSKIAKVTAITVGATLVFVPAAIGGAPVIATAAGKAGLLGASGTGTAISSLSGAALTKASLAAIGGGSIAGGGLGMTGGVVFLTAAGASLGAIQGGAISNSYFGEVKGFKIEKVNEGKGPALIFVNGFLSQENQNSKDWREAVRQRFSDNPWYYVTWESKSTYELGKLFSSNIGSKLLKEILVTTSQKGSKKFIKYLNPYHYVLAGTDMFMNPWHSAMSKATMTGILLADLLARVKNEDGFILMGHSLGARVIHSLLCALSTKDNKIIREVYLLAGAVGRNDARSWRKACSAVDGKVYNCYSRNDEILKYLYQTANLYQSSPIGLGGISGKFDNIVNFNASKIVNGHMDYKNKFGIILNSLNSNQ